jgi:hypothetical protein
MQPLDRTNASLRRDAAAMRAATLQQQLENEEQRTRVREMKDTSDAMRDRLDRRSH